MATATTIPPGQPPFADMVWIPGGTFLMGSDHHYPEEAPSHTVTVEGFWIDTYTVTNAQFQRFVKETGYVTLAERVPNAAEYPGAKPELLVELGLWIGARLVRSHVETASTIERS